MVLLGLLHLLRLTLLIVKDMGMMINRRRTYGGREILPYGAVRIEYLQSSGTQYIDTRYAFSDNYQFEICYSDITSAQTMFGARNSNVRTSLLYRSTGYGLVINIAEYVDNSTPFRLGFIANEKHTIKFRVSQNKGTSWVDGTISQDDVAFNGTYISGVTQALFATKYSNGSFGDKGSGKIYFVKMWQGDTLVRNFIPVRVGNVGYMYDKVSGQLFGNSGTGDFILGPDVDEVGVSYVDLGLPSGNLWATKNIGANAPEDYGLYFAWGETTGYVDAAARNAALGRSDGFSTAAYIATGANQISADLTIQQDAVHAYLGGDWMMPTSFEFKELYDNCTSVWTTENGVYGRRFTSNNNSKYIFIPAAGNWGGNSTYNIGSYGYYWSSSYSSNTNGYVLSFHSGGVAPYGTTSRRVGLTIRPVKSPN